MSLNGYVKGSHKLQESRSTDVDNMMPNERSKQPAPAPLAIQLPERPHGENKNKVLIATAFLYFVGPPHQLIPMSSDHITAVQQSKGLKITVFNHQKLAMDIIGDHKGCIDNLGLIPNLI